MLVDPVTKPIPIDTFKTHMLSLGLHLVMWGTRFFCNEHLCNKDRSFLFLSVCDLLLHVRDIE